MYRITSIKKNIIALSGTNNDVEFHNKLFDTDDCVIEFVPGPTEEEIIQEKAIQDQNNLRVQEINEKKNFLLFTDYKIIRQLEQNTLNTEEYSTLLAERQTARNRINELEIQIELINNPESGTESGIESGS